MKPFSIKAIFSIFILLGLLGWNYLRQCDGLFKKYEHELAVCAIFKNETPYLKEWIDYHHEILGASKFYLYNNDSSDDYKAVLNPYIENGLVELIAWGSIDEHAIDVEAICKFPWDRYQIGAYTHCCKKLALGKVRWLAVHDIDEYLVPTKDLKNFRKMLKSASRPNLKKFLKNPFKINRSLGCLKIHWLLFGTSRVWDLEPNQLLTDTLTFRAQDNYIGHVNTKCLYRPEAIDTCLIHNAYLKKNQYRSKDIPFTQCRIHHYITGTEKRFIEKRKPSTDQYEAWQVNLNQVEDQTLIQFRNKMTALERSRA